MERLKRTTRAALLSLLSLAILLKPQARSLQIRPQACYNSMGDLGTCMFVWECIKTEGKHLGTCADGFLFGSCCAHSDSKNNLIPQTDTTTTSSIDITTFITPHTFTSSISESEVFNNFRPTAKPDVSELTGTRSPIKPAIQSSQTISSSNHTHPPLSQTKQPSIQTQPSSSQTRPPPIQKRPPPSQTRPPPSQTRPPPIQKRPPPSQTRPPPSQTRLPPSQTNPPPSQTRLPPSHTKPPPSQTRLPPSQTKPPYLKPVPHSRPPFKPSYRPTSKPKPSTTTSNSPSLVTIENFLSRSTITSSQGTTTKPFVTVLSNESQGQVTPVQFSTINGGWFRPTGYTTKRPQYPTKPSNTLRPQTTQRTTHYPYVRPSWRPRPPGFSTSSKPHVFTSSTYYPTRPTTSKTTQLPEVVSESTSADFQNVTKFPVSVIKTTTQSFSTKKPTAYTTIRPFFSTTDRTSPTSSDLNTIKYFNVTMIPFFTSFRPEIQTVSTSTTQFFWFTSSTTKFPSNTDRYNTTVVNGSLLVESTTPTSTRPPLITRPTIRPNGEMFPPTKPNFSTSSHQEEFTTVSSKKTTPLPISPCGLQNPHPQKKVVGGKNSAFGSWPWQASVRRTSFFGFSSTHRCGGALISRQWVATAGHCVDDLLLSQIKIRVGEYDFASVQEPHGYVERGAKKKVVHPRYNFFTYENDLALVQLEDAIDSVKYPHISPICLPPSEESLVGRNATVTGWGRLSEGGILPSILQEVQVPIISNEKCKNMFLAAGRHEYIPDIFMCAGFEEGGRDSCQGDSGGPLQIQTEEGYWFLAGIISWGIGCAEPNMPGVCTRISKFKDWVVQHIT